MSGNEEEEIRLVGFDRNEDETLRLVPYPPKREPFYRNPDLELLLQNVFSQKLQFPSEHPEVLFIQKAIEKIVGRIAKELEKYKSALFETVDKASTDTKPACNIADLEQESGNNLFKLGSFYERTKNTFPDEFDYVYVPYHLTKEDHVQHPYFELKDEAFRRRVSYLSNAGSLVYRDKDIGDVFFEKYEGQSDIAAQFQFAFVRNIRYYRRGKRLKRTIRVNLIPGILVLDQNLAENVRQLCPISGFRKDILTTCSSRYLLLPSSFTAFCESEVHFMNHVLSNKHVTVYRLLKYIIHGNRSGEELEAECKRSKHKLMCSIPSYAIKTAMIRHHFECVDDHSTVGACVLDVLHMFEQCYSYPVTRFGQEDSKLFIEIATPTNRPLTIAFGDEDFILAGKQYLTKMIKYLRFYKKVSTNDLILDPFSLRMITAVKRYNNTHGSRTRQLKSDVLGDFGADTLGKCFYKLGIFFIVLGFIVMLFYLLVKRN